MAQPVFYDPRQARWKRLRRLFDVLGLAIGLVIVFFVYNAVRNQNLPKLEWEEETKPYHALREKERERAKERRRAAALIRTSRLHDRIPPLRNISNEQDDPRAAFYVPWDAASFSSLREYAHQIDFLYPE